MKSVFEQKLLLPTHIKSLEEEETGNGECIKHVNNNNGTCYLQELKILLWPCVTKKKTVCLLCENNNNNLEKTLSIFILSLHYIQTS